jgi:3-hydroxyisobutyrate dehydrogenase-like beta-hydroxyacid dehydrogenase
MIVRIIIGTAAEALLICEKSSAKMVRVKEAIAGRFADTPHLASA